MGLGSSEENKRAGPEPEAEELAMLAPTAAQHGDRIPLEFRQMAEQRPAARELGKGLPLPRREIRRRQGRHAVGSVGHHRSQWMKGSIAKRACCV